MVPHPPRKSSTLRALYGLPEYWMITNHYGRELKTSKDIESMNNWICRISGVLQAVREQADAGEVRRVMKASGQGATTLYLGGHTMTSGDKGLSYIPVDHLKKGKNAQKEVPFTKIRDILMAEEKSTPLLVIVDACNLTNFLELPFILSWDGDKPYWGKTEYYREDSGSGRNVICFASTEPGVNAHDFPSTGAIFTREFCNIPLDESITLARRSQRIQYGVDAFLLEHSRQKNTGKALTQKHQVYSAREVDLADEHPFETMFGYYCQDVSYSQPEVCEPTDMDG